ncbi:E3 ubiquitin-protein ligase RNF14 [Microdochium nivale]|nr:E3 ubiquitin-protein ligase RNF14 [Microdochium nivale]
MNDETHSLSISQLAEIKRRIETGISIHDLQELVSAELNLAGTNEHLNPLQIELRAVGGLRPGSIPGRNWYVGMVASTWFCQKLCIRVRPPHQQIIIQAFNQEYIFFRPRLNPQGTISARTVGNWFLRRVVLTIGGANSWDWEVNRDNIICHDRDGSAQLHDQSRIAGGATITIVLPRDVAARYIEAEASMVPDTRICLVCGDNKRPSEMPTRITAACEHANEMCKNCVEQWVASSLEGAWDRMRCPQCPRRLKFLDVAALADRVTFARYDDLVTRTFLSSLADFRWCINPRCEAGQLYAPDCLRARCNYCKRDMCVQHSMPWHNGETCSQFDQRNFEQREGEEASREVVQSSSKACPSCNRDVHKYEGCNHITCLCGHQWCYLCLAPYTNNREGFPVAHHAPGCGR